MRDPDRIDDIIELLREAWHRTPDQRLTQLIMNATRTRDGQILSTSALWNSEDWALKEQLKRQNNYELYSTKEK